MSGPSVKDRDFAASLGAPWQVVGQVAAYREECERAERERIISAFIALNREPAVDMVGEPFEAVAVDDIERLVVKLRKEAKS